MKVPENHIVIDFDIQDMDGNKSYELNLKEASKWPPTYAELSKSGQGIHLHYIYAGDVSKLSRVYDDHIEVKVFTGKSSLRRKLTKCNDLPSGVCATHGPAHCADCVYTDCHADDVEISTKYILGSNDLNLMTTLRNAGTDHRKFMRMITVYLDITAPLYWWKEFDTYKVGTVANSCSTMHKIADKPRRKGD